jgi:hypothetical protein
MYISITSDIKLFIGKTYEASFRKNVETKLLK